MSKYVELKPLFKILGERGYLNIETGFEEEVLNELEQSLPTIDIVKCKGCVKHKTHKCHMAFDLVATEDKDFCSYGERSEE